jgi:hypothetical protein
VANRPRLEPTQEDRHDGLVRTRGDSSNEVHVNDTGRYMYHAQGSLPEANREILSHTRVLNGRVSQFNGHGWSRSSSFRGGGVGRNMSIGVSVKKNRHGKCWKVY